MRKEKELVLSDKIKQRTELKLRNVDIYNIASRARVSMTEKVLERIKNCGTFLEFATDENREKAKLLNANFCENRFCPNCAANQARKLAIELAISLEWIKEKYGYRFIFLTLTAPNIPAHEVEDELRDYSKSFKRLFERKPVKAICKGYIRKLEMTYNIERNDYHPHYHVVVAVNKSYFTDKNYYLSQKKWLEMWRESKRDWSIEAVDVRAVNENNLEKSVQEFAKYIAKDSNYAYSLDVFSTFYRTLKGKRYIAFKGIFDEAHKKYEAGELEYLKDVEEIEWVYKLRYSWKDEKYQLMELLKLTESEKKKLNSSPEEIENNKRNKKITRQKNINKLLEIQHKKLQAKLISKKKTKDLRTGEMEFVRNEKDKIEKRLEFEKMVDKFNDKYKK